MHSVLQSRCFQFGNVCVMLSAGSVHAYWLLGLWGKLAASYFWSLSQHAWSRQGCSLPMLWHWPDVSLSIIWCILSSNLSIDRWVMYLSCCLLAVFMYIGSWACVGSLLPAICSECLSTCLAKARLQFTIALASTSVSLSIIWCSLSSIQGAFSLLMYMSHVACWLCSCTLVPGLVWKACWQQFVNVS